MQDKHGTPLKVGDLLISGHRSSSGNIYRIREIVDTDPNAVRVGYGPRQANCISMYDRFLAPKDRGKFCTWGDDVVKVDKKYASEMVSKWDKLFQKLLETNAS